MQSVLKFWKDSYSSDQTAFFLELTSFVFTVAASGYLAINAQQPDMRFVYPAFLIGAASGCYAYYRRQLAWPMLLTGYFCFVNVFGFGRALSWW